MNELDIENGGDSSIDAQTTTKNPLTINAQAIENAESPETNQKRRAPNGGNGRPKGAKNRPRGVKEGSRRGDWVYQPPEKPEPGEVRKGTLPKMKYDARQDLKSCAKDFSNEAVFTLVKIMRDKNNSATNRMAAAAMILDRGHGKAVNQTEISVGVYDRYSNDELIKFITGQTNSLIDVTPSKKSDS